MKVLNFSRCEHGGEISIVVDHILAWEVRPANRAAGLKEKHTAIFVGDCVFLVLGDQDTRLTNEFYV